MVGEAKWKPLELPLPGYIVNQRQKHIPGGTTEISATIKVHGWWFPPQLLLTLSGQYRRLIDCGE